MPRVKKTVTKSVIVKKAPLLKKKKAYVPMGKIGKKTVTNKIEKEPSTKKTVASTLSFPVMSPKGEKVGVISLPSDLFNAPFNRQLVSQAMRVFRLNQREGSAATKTRGMVEGSTRKIYRQKGTGRARHGGIRAPIFVGGGIVFGPSPKSVRKTLPKHMKINALSSALSYKRAQNAMHVVEGIAELPIKTKVCDQMITNLKATKPLLFVYGEESQPMVRAVRNIAHVSVFPYYSLNTYEVMTHKTLVFAKDALKSLIVKYAKSQV